MKKRDEGKASLVEFLRSLKYSQGNNSMGQAECATHFAQFNPQVKIRGQFSAEDAQLIRSAN